MHVLQHAWQHHLHFAILSSLPFTFLFAFLHTLLLNRIPVFPASFLWQRILPLCCCVVLSFFLIFALKRHINKSFSLKWRITTGLCQIQVATSKCQKENRDCLFSGPLQMTTKLNPDFILITTVTLVWIHCKKGYYPVFFNELREREGGREVCILVLEIMGHCCMEQWGSFCPFWTSMTMLIW